MRHLPAMLLSLGLTACTVSGTYSGTITDAMTGNPRGDIRVVAKSEGSTDLTCMAKEATADASGTFKLEKLCAGNNYALTLSDDTLLVEDPPTVDGGAQVDGAQIKTWRAPAGSGIYILKGDELSMVRTFTDVKYETKVDDPAMKVAYPYSKPTKLTYVVEPGSYFVISGQSNVDRLKWQPLIADPGKRTFVDGSIENHAWVGVRFNSDTEWEKVEAQLDASKIKTVQSGERIVQYIPADALPEGRYTLFGENDNRMFIVDFGKSQDQPAPAE